MVQEAFLNAYKGLKSFRRESKFSTWFTRIILNEAFKHIKGADKNMQNVTPETSEEIVEEVAGTWDSIRREERQYYIRNAILKLPPKEAMVLTLYYLEKQSLEEICNVSGLSASAGEAGKVLIVR